MLMLNYNGVREYNTLLFNHSNYPRCTTNLSRSNLLNTDFLDSYMSLLLIVGRFKLLGKLRSAPGLNIFQ